jgi:hypothetical protein
VGLAAALVAAAASVVVYVAARAAGVPMELTEVFEDQFARMPLMNVAWAALLDGIGRYRAGCRVSAMDQAPPVVLRGAGVDRPHRLFLPAHHKRRQRCDQVVLAISHVIVAIIIVPALAMDLPRGTPGHSSRYADLT